MNLLFSLHPSRHRAAPDCHSRPARKAREELNTWNQLSAFSRQLSAKTKNFVIPTPERTRGAEESRFCPHPETRKGLPLRELESLASALLSVLLALFAARVPADHALGL